MCVILEGSWLTCVEMLLTVFNFLSPSQSLQEEEEEEVARGTKGKARATAPTPQQPPLRQEWEAAEPPHLPHAPPPPPPPLSRLRRHSTKCLHLTNYDDSDNRSRTLLTSVMLAFFLFVFKKITKEKQTARSCSCLFKGSLKSMFSNEMRTPSFLSCLY